LRLDLRQPGVRAQRRQPRGRHRRGRRRRVGGGGRRRARRPAGPLRDGGERRLGRRRRAGGVVLARPLAPGPAPGPGGGQRVRDGDRHRELRGGLRADAHRLGPAAMSARHRARRLPAPAVVAAAWLAGSIPFSNIAARRVARVDLRGVGHGTVSGTALYEVAGFRPLAAAGVCEVAKGAVGPVLAGRDRPGLGALAATAAVAGHNWSPWLGGAGGRGVSVALGAFLPLAWPGTVALALGLAGGRLARQTGLGTLIGAAATVPLVRRTHGRAAAAGAAGIVGVMVAKRLAGN